MKGLFGQTIRLIEKSLDVRLKRHEVISANLANLDTPAYRRKDLPFEKALEAALGKWPPLARTNPRHLPTPEAAEESPWMALEEDEYLPPDRGTPNNVDLDEEVAKLMRNHLLYQSTIQSLIKEFELLREAITEGGKSP
ncbi:flagellar basal body rod protein FlgB [Thermosulfuriphilus ammonigenes]|uniref:Flagellar basal body rod protein FlgB n=1 Tax=Thermosulfuriphilus ammonigenes TaxID=1936021 RepID=A0A6G7PZ03_9BACT|nr:flagellar basal body rod protein FlgB [Thermosulfuriphilus ammonigenes]MBA2849819.1 flagellar basal-body rod protein FlgB [Thermosulfuriphilus ammonigenes]QIJ72633.1 flagellar basal body rod protein FlgB [Thermosulfuriphilus ammonigenes]